jgi:ribonuclease-3 family protein
MTPKEHNGASLAYLGDAVLEVLARHAVLQSGVQDAGKLNQLALSYVRATAQSAAAERVLPFLTQEEEAMFRRGRNIHHLNTPKSASQKEYRQASGLESLFGYLYLEGQVERAKELFSLAFPSDPT